jgi:uncharacterized LabA/DUF88 family protein
MVDNLIIMSRHNNYAYIDGANLHITYENLDWKLDYQKLLVYLQNKFDVFASYYFIGNTPQSVDIRKNLESYGYNVKLKEPSPYYTEEDNCPYCGKVITPVLSKNKADIDSFMTLTIMSDLDLFSKAVLITSDGDFDELVKMLVRQDKLRVLFAPCKDGCSKLLKRAAVDKIVFMDELRTELEKKQESSYGNPDP